MSQTTALTIRLSPADNVVVARAALRAETRIEEEDLTTCLLYTSPSPRDGLLSRMPSSA